MADHGLDRIGGELRRNKCSTATKYADSKDKRISPGRGHVLRSGWRWKRNKKTRT